MNIKRLFLTCLMVLLAIILLLPGCELATPQTPVLTPTAPIISPPEESAPSSPISVDLSFPNGAPALNREAEMKVTVSAKAYPVKNMKVWVVLPEAVILVRGDLSWTGSIPLGEKSDVMKAVVKSVKTGNWEIKVHSYVDPKDYPSFSFGSSGLPIYISISEQSAQWGITPPWYNKETPAYPKPTQSRPGSAAPLKPSSAWKFPTGQPPKAPAL